MKLIRRQLEEMNRRLGKDPKNEKFTLVELEVLSDSGRMAFGRIPSTELLIKDCRKKLRELTLLAELDSYDLGRELTDKVKDMNRTSGSLRAV